MEIDPENYSYDGNRHLLNQHDWKGLAVRIKECKPNLEKKRLGDCYKPSVVLQKKLFSIENSIHSFWESLMSRNETRISQGRRQIKHKFTGQEDRKLKRLVKRHGNNWSIIQKYMVDRSARQCRERWKYFLNPELNKDDWSIEEDQLLLEKVDEIGPKWSSIASYFNSRSDVAIKNRYSKLYRDQHRKAKFPMDDNESFNSSAKSAAETNDNNDTSPNFLSSEDENMGSSTTRRLIDFPCPISQWMAISG